MAHLGVSSTNNRLESSSSDKTHDRMLVLQSPRKQKVQNNFGSDTSRSPSVISPARTPNESTNYFSNTISPESLPMWTAEEYPDRHLWYDTNGSGESCFLSDAEFQRSSPRKKCATCKIVCHTSCIPKLSVRCRATFREAGSQNYRESAKIATSMKHHWIERHQKDLKCNACGKSTQNKFFFKDTAFLQCTWCKVSYHGKSECLTQVHYNGECSLGRHANLIIPPSWIVKIADPNSFRTSVRRSPSNPAFALSLRKPPMLMRTLACSSESLVKTSALSTSALSLPTTPVGARPGSAATRDFPFVIKPNPKCKSSLCPLVVFINPKAGGNQGGKLLRKFQWLLNPRQIFCLDENGPLLGLQLYGRIPNVRILVCGGDGTVGWILSAIDSLGLDPLPPVAVLPLGTGNDLARTLHWGPGYTDESLAKILSSVEGGRIVLLDRWNLISKPLPYDKVELDEESEYFNAPNAVDKLPLSVINNYFSLGADAATALEFHESREANPDRFNSRLKNKMFYAGVGGIDLIRRSWKDLSDYVTLVCDDVDQSAKLKELRPHVILFLNIPRYSAGTVPWGHPSDSGSLQRIDDRKIEVIGLTTAALASLQLGSHGDRICQCSRVQLITRKVIPMQVDGEPCRLCPSEIEIHLRNQAFVIQKPRRADGASPAHSLLSTGGERSVSAFIILPKQKCDFEDLDSLCKTARFFANLNIGAHTDLSVVRALISKSSMQPAVSPPNDGRDQINRGLPSEWIFLDMTAINGNVFGIDPSTESSHFLIDILSDHDELFLIDISHNPPGDESGDQAVNIGAGMPNRDPSLPGNFPSLPTKGNNCGDTSPKRRGSCSPQFWRVSDLDLSVADPVPPTRQHRTVSSPGALLMREADEQIWTSEASVFGTTSSTRITNVNCVTKGSIVSLNTAQFEEIRPSHPTENTTTSHEQQQKKVQPTVAAASMVEIEKISRRANGWRRTSARLRRKLKLSLSADVKSMHIYGFLPKRVLSLSSLCTTPGGCNASCPKASTLQPANGPQALLVAPPTSGLPVENSPSERCLHGDSPAVVSASFPQVVSGTRKLSAAFLRACRDGDLEDVRYLLDIGVSPLVVDSAGLSGLHMACKYGHLEVVEYLLRTAPPEILELRDFKKEQTALHKAAAYRRRRICEALVRARASLLSEDRKGQTPRLLALTAKDDRLALFLHHEELREILAKEQGRIEI